MENIEKLADLHMEHAGWQSLISSLKEEIASLNNRLGQMLLKRSPRNVPAMAEHFQNQLILQKEQLDIMRHDFKQYENMIENEQKNSASASTELLQMRAAYDVRLKDYIRILNDLQGEYEVFEKQELISA